MTVLETDQSVERPGSLAFLLLFLSFGFFLLATIGTETRFSSGGGFFAQPRVWPAIGIGGMLFFGILQLLVSWRCGWTGILPEVATWLASLEYLVWFMVYVVAVPVTGYLPTSIAFTTLLAVRQGYRSAAALLSAAALGVTVVAVFKAGLSVRIPGATIYEYLPGTLRNFMILNF